jgi:hypothetical protein
MRKLDDWVKTYLEYVENTESAKVLHEWTAYSLISAALMKKVWFEFGRFMIFPNLYVVFVSEPGISRKTQAINCGGEILHEVTQIVTSADATTPQAMLEDLEIASKVEIMPDGTGFEHNSLTIQASELETFLGQKRENAKMIILLTDLYDCKYRPYRYRTKGAGSNEIKSVFLTMLSATTPESLATCFPTSAFGGGLASRMTFVWAEGKEKPVAIPEIAPETLKLKELLINDLAEIAKTNGAYRYTSESRRWWIDWYNNYDERDPDRKCLDSRFSGWYSRKPTLVIKVAQLITASRTNSMYIETEFFQEALEVVERLEPAMAKSFSAVGRSEITADVDDVMRIVEQYGEIADEKLSLLIYRDVDSLKMSNVMDTCCRTGKIKRVWQEFSPGETARAYYKWIGDGDES